ncbi:MAG TPA: HlyD family efflux transporter periplasmic adaptor subunit [bacterium]|nr:HlyD family efflux transporter periplasmic adaptor subunit [bacterium]
MERDSYRTVKRVLLALGGLFLVAAVVWAIRPRPLAVELAQVARGPYEQEVVEDGITRAVDIYTVIADVEGNLRRVTLKAGDRVLKGQTVAVIDWGPERPQLAPVDGYVLRVQRDSEGPILRGAAIMDVADSHSLEVVADVLTTDAVRVRSGDPVRIEGWGGPKPLQGRVKLVEPSAFMKVSALGVEEQRVNVVITIVSPLEEWKGLGDNFRVDAHIVVASVDDALTVPTGALFREGDSWEVFAVEGGKARKRRVEIESRNPVKAVVASGLKAGETVILYPGDKIREGTRVKGLKSL